MNKSSFFGQPVFRQMISLIDYNKIKTISKKHLSDHYVKKFDTSDHLNSMLLSMFAYYKSSRYVAASKLGLKGKMKHFQFKSIHNRSTFIDTIKIRNHFMFLDIYYKLHHTIISDSIMLENTN